MHETAEFTIQILGLLIYGTAVFTLDLRILLITLLLFVLDVILRNRAIKYDTGHWGGCRPEYPASGCRFRPTGQDSTTFYNDFSESGIPARAAG